jgi:signal transduction histidine kinase
MKGRERIAGVGETPLVVVLPGGVPATPQALSHELQSPVKAIRLLAESVRTAAEDISPEQLERCMNSVLRTTTYMAELIGRMTGGAGLSVQTTDLHRLVRETVEDMRLVLGDRIVHLSLRPVDEVAADPTAIREIVVNLLSNATRYARPPAPISVRLAPTPGCVSLSITDRCGGIPPGLRMRIFEPFVRGYPGGMGLGLSLSKSIAMAHGGDLVLEDSPRGTCRFTLTLPAAVRVA